MQFELVKTERLLLPFRDYKGNKSVKVSSKEMSFLFFNETHYSNRWRRPGTDLFGWDRVLKMGNHR